MYEQMRCSDYMHMDVEKKRQDFDGKVLIYSTKAIVMIK